MKTQWCKLVRFDSKLDDQLIISTFVVINECDGDARDPSIDIKPLICRSMCFCIKMIRLGSL